MSLRLRLSVGGLAILIAIPVLILLGIWIWYLFSPNTLVHTWAQQGVWPVACSTRGCATTRDWYQQYSLAEHYAIATGTEPQTPTQALTTVIHHHLLAHASFKSSVTLADAKRYREQVLNVHQAQMLEKVSGVSTDEYDQDVILPFLQQEELRQEYKVESVDELYKLLSKDRFIISLLRHFRWDRGQAAVVSR